MNSKYIRILFLILFPIFGVIFIYLFFLNGTSAVASSPYLPKENPLGDGVKNIYSLVLKKISGSLFIDDAYENIIFYKDSEGKYTTNVFMDTINVRGLTLDDRKTTITTINNAINTKFGPDLSQNFKINIIMGIDLRTELNDGETMENLTEEEKKIRIREQIDETLNFFNNTNLNRVKLIGFYWTVESIHRYDSTIEMVTYFNDYVHGKGLKTLWSPYSPSYNRLKTSEIDEETLNSACNLYGIGKNLNYEACRKTGVNAYDDSNGYRLYKDELQMYGYEYGFDFVSLQPGYGFHGNNQSWNEYRSGNANIEVDRLDFTDDIAKIMHTGVEVGIDPDSAYNGSYYGYNGCSWYKERLAYVLQNGKEWNKSINLYYMHQMFSPNYLSQGGLARAYYDATYKYAMETLEQSDIDKISCDRNYYSNYENVSKGKSYESNASYYKNIDAGKTNTIYVVAEDGKLQTQNASDKYCIQDGYWVVEGSTWHSSLVCDDGVKLTDGVFGKSAYSNYDEWVGFYNGSNQNGVTTESGKLYNVIVDLGKKTTSLTYFALEFNNHIGGGIRLPYEVKAYIGESKNGDYVEIGTLNLASNRNIFEAAYYDIKLDKALSGRYIKFEFTYHGKDGLIFVSEAIVGKTSTISLSNNDNKTILNMGINDATIPTKTSLPLVLDNVDVDDLIISIENNDIVSANISDNYLNIIALKNGNTNITVEDTRYGTKVTHEVEVLGRYKITFDAGDGKLNGVSSIYAAYEYNKFFENLSSISGLQASNIVPSAEKQDYEFLGWYTSDGKKLFNSNLTLVNNVFGYTDSNGNWIKQADVKLKAQYTKKEVTSYVVTYNCQENGGIFDGPYDIFTEEKIAGSNVDLSNTCKKDNYEFLGWNTDKNATTKINSYEMPNRDVTLYGIYKKEAIILKAKFDSNGILPDNDLGEKTCTISEVFNKNEQDSTCTLYAPEINDNGYTVLGWSVSGDAIVSDKEYNLDTNRLTLNASDDEFGRRWYLVAFANRYKVTFDPSGGILNGSDTLYAQYNSNKLYQKNIDGGYGILPTVNKDDYGFMGWYTSSNMKLIDVDGTLISNVDGYTNDLGNWIVTEDITLYAQFEDDNDEPSEYIVDFTNLTDFGINNGILVLPGMNSDSLIPNVVSNGKLSIVDKNNIEVTDSMKLRTGYKLRATFTTRVIDYKISIRGDVLGTGELSRDNAKEIAKHVIKKNVINGNEYLLAADYNSDGNIKMNDVVKMLKDKNKQENH